MVVLSTIAEGTFMNEYRYMYIICCFAISLFIASMFKYINFTIQK